MSDVDPLVAQLESFQQEETSTEQVQEPVVETEPEPDLTEFGRRYLQTIEDEQERQVAERHVRRWDAGYAKQEQKWNEYREQYSQLGNVEDLRVGQQLKNLLETDPVRLVEYLYNKGVIYQPEEVVTPEEQVDPASAKLQQLEQGFNALAARMQQEEMQKQEQVQIAEFRRDLEEAKTRLGDFDDDLVIRLIAGGVSNIDDAVAMYRKVAQDSVNKNARQQAPTLLGSSGTPPTVKKPDFGKMSNKDINDYLVASLER